MHSLYLSISNYNFWIISWIYFRGDVFFVIDRQYVQTDTSFVIVSQRLIVYYFICRLKFSYQIYVWFFVCIWVFFCLKFRIIVFFYYFYRIDRKKYGYYQAQFINFIMLATTDSTQKSAPPNASFDKRVWGVYCQLQKAVDNMDRKVELVMQKHQSQFLYAYRTHIHKIKRQLEDIKRKSEEQERLFSSNDRIRYLEKQVAVFREEAIKLYETIEKKSLEIQNYQARIVQAELISKKMEAQNKELSLQIKMLIANQVGFYRKIEELQTKLDESNKKIQKLEQKIASQRSRRDFMQSIRQRASSLAKSRQNSPREIKTYKNQMQQWFLECVRTVKREIQQRKNNFDAIDLNKLTNLNEFRLVDKLRLFQLILENEKLLNWLYHKIFPDKLDKISQYLSQTQSIPATDTDFKSQAVPSQRYGSSVQQNFQLPKVQSKKLRNSNIRNQVTIKNGKMNISIL